MAHEKITDDQHFQRHTEKILSMIEAGVVPWHRPWRVGQRTPANIASGRAYTGFSNIMNLSFTPWSSPWWITRPKIDEFHGKLLPGEENNYNIVFYWHRWSAQNTDHQTGEVRNITKFYPRTHKVWNVDQTEGIVHHRLHEVPDTEHREIPDMDIVIRNYCSGRGPKLHIEGDRACYVPKTDQVFVPNAGRFDNVAEYASAVFHELGHSTGHQTRLNRKGITEVNTSDQDMYGREELIAEFCSSYALSMFEFTEEEFNKAYQSNASYLASWHKRISDDPKAFIIAANQAEKACRLIFEDRD